MTLKRWRLIACLAVYGMAGVAAPAQAHLLRERGKAVSVAGSMMSVVPARDWNSLSAKPGKNAETWTLDGEQLNELTFFCAVPSGSPLVRERNKKRDPLPKFTNTTLLVEVPELLESTYRASKAIGAFQLLSTKPARFLGQDGVLFSFAFTDRDELSRTGEARAVIINQKLYLIAFTAPRLHYFNRGVDDFRAVADSARLQ